MKKAFLLSAALAGMFTAYAQDAAQVDVKDAFTYNRSSLTVVPLVGIAGQDAHAINWADTVGFAGKFDMNRVKVAPISVKADFYTETVSNPETAPKGSLKQKMYGTVDAPAAIQEAILKELNGGKTGKAILDYWLGFDGTQFNPAIWEARSMYNATDADVLKDRASKVSALANNGMALMENTYVMVAGPAKFQEFVDKKGNKTYQTNSDAYVYRMVMSDDIKEFINNHYLTKPERKDYKNDEAYNKDLKKYNEDLAAYKNVKVEFEPVNTAYNVGESAGLDLASLMGKTETTEVDPIKQSVETSLNSLLEPLERKISKWEVVTSVYTMSPIGGKIGKKEGLKNSDRYGAFKLVEDENGELNYKFIGWVRATNIADNAAVADGESPCSNFYQISGTGLREGMFLKQKKDLKMSVAVSGVLDGISPALVDIDYLAYTHHTMGTMLSAGLSLGGYAGDVAEFNSLSGTWFNGAINITGAIHPIRWIEIAAQVGAGADYFRFVGDTTEDNDDSSASKRIAYFAHGGLRLGWQVWYPVQLFVRADYNYKLSEGQWYFNSSKARFDQLSFGAGVKVNF